MGDKGIHNLDVTYGEGGPPKTVERLAVRFGDDHVIELTGTPGGARLRMIAHGVEVVLDASGPGCCFERALNLLRLYLPQART